MDAKATTVEQKSKRCTYGISLGLDASLIQCWMYLLSCLHRLRFLTVSPCLLASVSKRCYVLFLSSSFWAAQKSPFITKAGSRSATCKGGYPRWLVGRVAKCVKVEGEFACLYNLADLADVMGVSLSSPLSVPLVRKHVDSNIGLTSSRS